jgi:hypothetical protein
LSNDNIAEVITLYEKYDLTPILIELANSKSYEWYRKKYETKYVDCGTDDEIKYVFIRKIYNIFDMRADKAGYLFQIKMFYDKSEPEYIRNLSIEYLRNANIIEVKQLLVNILKESTDKCLYGSNEVAALRYIAGSDKYEVNMLWDIEVRDAFMKYLDVVEIYTKMDPDNVHLKEFKTNMGMKVDILNKKAGL